MSAGFTPRWGDSHSFCSHSRPGKQNHGIDLPRAPSPLPPQKPSWCLREKGPGLRGQDMGSDWPGVGLTNGWGNPSSNLSLPSRSAPRPQANPGGACSWASQMDQPCLKGGWGEHTALGLADVSARKGRPPCPDGRPKAASAQHTGQTAARQPLRAPGMSTARAAVGSRKDAQARS